MQSIATSTRVPWTVNGREERRVVATDIRGHRRWDRVLADKGCHHLSSSISPPFILRLFWLKSLVAAWLFVCVPESGSCVCLLDRCFDPPSCLSRQK